MGLGELMAKIVSGIENDEVPPDVTAAFVGVGACCAALTFFRGIDAIRLRTNIARTAIILQRIFMSSSFASAAALNHTLAQEQASPVDTEAPRTYQGSTSSSYCA